MTWTLQNATSASWSDSNRLRTISVGNPIGLLLVLTYSTEFTVGDSWDSQNPTSSTWTGSSPTSGGFSISDPTSTTWT